jgi:septum site-determining protein MinC
MNPESNPKKDTKTGIAAVGDLSKLAHHAAGLDSTLTGMPFAPSQAIVAEAIPAALAAKIAAAAATPEVETPPTETSPIEIPPAETPPTETPPTETPPPESALLESNQAPQVRFKNEQGKLLLILPNETNEAGSLGTLSYAWPEIMTQLRTRLQTETRNWAAHTAVHLISRDRLLNAQQLQEIVEALSSAKMQLRRVYTSRRQTGITAATAGYSVEQHIAVNNNLSPAPAEAGTAMAEPLVLKTTLRSGGEVRHNGTVVIIGDANPGSSIIAEGDIVVWGRLRGNAHAGSKGNPEAQIMALQMEPAQIRIADRVARGPATTPNQFFPELAYITSAGQISIARMSDFKEGIAKRNATANARPPRSTHRKMPATGKQL